MKRAFGTIGAALICVVLMSASVLSSLVDCAATSATAASARDASAASLPPESGPLYRYITTNVQGGQGTSFCDASELEPSAALGPIPARADGFAVGCGALISLSESSQGSEAWATRPVPPLMWFLPPEPPPQGKM